MKILLVSFGFTNLANRYFYSMFKEEGYEVDFYVDPVLFSDHYFEIESLSKFFSYKNKFLEKIESFEPDLVGFSTTIIHYKKALYYSSLIKKYCDKTEKEIKTVLGGPYITSNPHNTILNNSVDFICIGEGEEAFLELVQKYESGDNCTNIKNIWTIFEGKLIKNDVRAPIKNLDKLPFPVELPVNSFPPSKIFYSTMSLRGCPYACSYCMNDYYNNNLYFKKKFLRRRSVDNFISELKIAKKKYDPEFIHFNDDDFLYDKKWLKEFSKKYSNEIGLPYFCFGNPSNFSKREIDYLSDSNCHSIELGVQSVNSDLCKDVLNRYNNLSKIKENINYLVEKGIFVQADNLYNLPTQTKEDILSVLKLYNEARPSRFFFFKLNLFPKTKIVDYYDSENLSKKEIRKRISSGVVVNPKNENLSELFMSQIIFLSIFFNYIPKKVVMVIIKFKLYRLIPPIPEKFLNVFRKKSKYDLISKRVRNKYFYFTKKKIHSSLIRFLGLFFSFFERK
ncbi:MAG: B12-binding domain-containing radical SAM protein [Candidatus Woesearchaeota archaeon]